MILHVAKINKIAVFASDGDKRPDDILMGNVGRMYSLHLARSKG